MHLPSWQKSWPPQIPSPASPGTPTSSSHSVLYADTHLSKVSPSTGPWSKALLAKAGKLQLFDEDSRLRRSCRQKIQKKGFKNTTCSDKYCIACDSKPPTMSPSIIKNLGATFCKVDANKLEKISQPKRKKVPAPVGKKSLSKKQSSEDNDKKK